MTEKIIVLGGSGFLGSQIIKSLQKNGSFVVTCGDIHYDKTLNCDFVYLDLLDQNDVINKLVDYNIIINCIGQITSPFNLCFKLNSLGIQNLVKATSNKNFRIIHISTVAVYGSIKYCNEESLLNPETNYATAKAFAEQALLDSYDQKHITILRLTNLYGGNQLKGIFAYLMRSYNSDRVLNFNNDGKLKRFFMHIEDCAELIVEVVKNRMLQGVYNVKGHESYSVLNLIEEFEHRFNVNFEKYFNQDPPWENIDKMEDSKLKSKINIQPKWKLFDFIEKELISRSYV